MTKVPKILDFRHFLAHLPGFEPGAFRLGGGPSILLRYKRIHYTIQTFNRLPFEVRQEIEEHLRMGLFHPLN